MNFSDDVRAPLEFTKVSKRQIRVICYKCKYDRMLSIDSRGFICSKCNNYISYDDFLYEGDSVGSVSRSAILPNDYKEFRKKAERDAYAYRDKMLSRKNKKT